MSPRRTLLATMPVLALALALVGCGGGGGDESTESAPTATTPTTTALTKAELIKQGDAICAEVNAAVGTVGASGGETSNGASQVADLYSGMVQSLKGLGTPQEAAGYAEFNEAAEALSKAEDEVKLAAERGDETALASAESSASTALASFKSAAGEYGFEQCTEAPSAPTSSAGGAPQATPEEAEAGGVEGEAEAAPEEAPAEVAPETGGAGSGPAEGGGTGGGAEGGGGGTSGGGSGGIGPG